MVCDARSTEADDSPWWQFGFAEISQNSEVEKAQQGPTLTLGMPEVAIDDDHPTSHAPAEMAQTENPEIQPTFYQIGSGYAAPEELPDFALALDALALSPAELTLSPAELPAPADLELPTVPAEIPDRPPSEAGKPGTEIGAAIEAGDVSETPPLEEETLSWYEIPWRWATVGWKNHAEIGLDGASGNSSTLAYQMGLAMKRKTERYTLAIDFNYRKASNAGLTTEDNGRFNLDYDHLITDSKWSGFAKYGTAWDQFKAYDLQINLNGGLAYHFVRTDDATLLARFGAGASQEIGAPDDSWTPEALFGGEAEYQVNRYNKLKGKVDYFPAWEKFSDYRMVTDAAWEILLDDKDNLSLKLAVTNRHDSTPQGAKPNDIYYSLLLLVKF